MSHGINYFRIGMFVITAFALVVMAVFLFTARNLFREDYLIETCFNETVQGLDAGSPMKYLGVKVGEVKSIGFVFEDYVTDKAYVLVRIAVDPDRMIYHPPNKTSGDDLQDLCRRFENDVQRGLRIRLANQGLTGVSYLEADFNNGNGRPLPPLIIDWTPRYPYIPSTPSTLLRVSSSVEEVLNHLKKVDFEGIASRVATMLDATSMTITNDIRLLLSKWNKMTDHDIQPAISNINLATSTLPQTVKHIDDSLKNFSFWAASKQPNIDEILENARAISINLEALSDLWRQYPSFFFFGAPPIPIGRTK